MMDERKQLLEKMMHEENSKGWLRSAAQKKNRAAGLQVHIHRLKQLLFDTKSNFVSAVHGSG